MAGVHEAAGNGDIGHGERRLPQQGAGPLEPDAQSYPHELMVVDDVSEALRTLNVEPLFGYITNRPLKYGEASLG